MDSENGQNTLTPGVDYFVTNNAEGPSVSFLFQPEFIDFGLDKDPIPIVITAEVTLRAWLTNGVAATSDPTPQVSRQIPLNLPVKLAPLEIPTILALFRLENYRSLTDDLEGGFVLMVVPSYSPLLRQSAEIMVSEYKTNKDLTALISLDGDKFISDE